MYISTHRHVQVVTPHAHSQLRSNKATLYLLVSALKLNKHPSHSLLSGKICALLCILLFKITSKHNADMLSSVPKHMKALMCLVEKIHVSDKLCSGLSHSAVGC